MKRTVILDIAPTPVELASEFSNMGDEDQAMFFSELARIVDKWDKPFCFQLQALINNPALTHEGRSLMQIIGEYGSDLTNQLRGDCPGGKTMTTEQTSAGQSSPEVPCCARFTYGQPVKFALGDSTYQQCTFVGTDMHGVSTVLTKGGRYKQVWDCNLYQHNSGL